MEEEVKKYLAANGRRIIEEWCALQKDTLLNQLIGFMKQEQWEAEHGYKKEVEVEKGEAEEEELPPREDRGSGVETPREDAQDGETNEVVETAL